MSLVEELVAQLGVSNDQAEGGAGLLFGLAKDKLADGDFSQLLDVLPDDVEALIGRAPSASAEASSGGMMGGIGAVADAIGLGDVADKLEDLGGLVGGFEKLGLDADMVSKFAATLIEFLKSRGGDQIVGLLQSILK